MTAAIIRPPHLTIWQMLLQVTVRLLGPDEEKRSLA